MRYDEDWRFLADARCRTDPWDRLKYLPFGADRFVSFGGEARIRYERFDNPGFGRDPEDASGYLLQRYLLHADAWMTPRLRAFAQVESSLVNGRLGGPRANDSNVMDLNQGFVEWTPHRQGADSATLRLGRQEVELGSSQFTSARNGLNDRQSFDGVRAFGEWSGWRFHAMATRVVPTQRGAFNDASHAGDTLSGFFIARSHALVGDGNGVVYVNRRETPRSVYQEGTYGEARITAGTRWWGTVGAWDYNYEIGMQTGRFGPGTIRAWYVSTDTGYAPEGASRTRLGLRFNVGSGDRHPGDGRLNTFSPLFAATAYSGLSGLVGPSNSIAAAPSVSWRVREDVTVNAGVIGFWRQTVEDGIYNVSTEVQRTASSSRERHVGTQATLQVVWQVSRHLSWLSTLSWFRAGAFLKDVPPAEDVTYFTTWWAWRF